QSPSAHSTSFNKCFANYLVNSNWHGWNVPPAGGRTVFGFKSNHFICDVILKQLYKYYIFYIKKLTLKKTNRKS
ncbi:MAG: hypothetical protein Q7J10_02400, partial [Methanosarcinaceae archaeon]|nr:hypothetical protein [Methanosarcinaceae archaeon]